MMVRYLSFLLAVLLAAGSWAQADDGPDMQATSKFLQTMLPTLQIDLNEEFIGDDHNLHVGRSLQVNEYRFDACTFTFTEGKWVQVSDRVDLPPGDGESVSFTLRGNAVFPQHTMSSDEFVNFESRHPAPYKDAALRQGEITTVDFSNVDIRSIVVAKTKGVRPGVYPLGGRFNIVPSGIGLAARLAEALKRAAVLCHAPVDPF